MSSDQHNASTGASPDDRARAEFGVLASILRPFVFKYIQLIQTERMALKGLITIHEEGLRKKNLDIANIGKSPDSTFYEMALVYTVSVFDAFLSDLSKFLYLTNLKAIPIDITLPVNELTSSAKVSSAITTRVDKKCRDIAAQPMIDRIMKLNDQFKLGIDLEKDERDRIARLSQVRNQLVHSHADFSLQLDESLAVILRDGAAREIEVEHVEGAVNFLGSICEKLYCGAAKKYERVIAASQLEDILKFLRLVSKQKGPVKPL